MLEEKEKVKKLSDEELDQVSGGKPCENANICKAISENWDLMWSLNAKERRAVGDIDHPWDADPEQLETLAGILLNYFGIHANLQNGRAGSSGTINGKYLTPEDIIYYIRRYKSPKV